MAQQLLGILAGVLSFAAYIPYIHSIITKKTRPSRSSWWIWSLIGFLILVSYYTVGARNTIWIPTVFFFCPLVVAILSLRYGAYERLSRLDIYCLALALAAAPIFFIAPTVTLFIGIAVDALAYIPTIVKTMHNPLLENKHSWLLFLAGSICNIFAVEIFSVSVILYPVYMFVMDVLMVWLVVRRRPLQ